MKHRILFALAVCLLTLSTANAQFYSVGDDPGSVKWRVIQTAHYKIIYPFGLDSLAKSYGMYFEQFRIPDGRSAGFTPCQYSWGKMPVVLHAHYAYSNGSVTWAPSRVDLYTTPGAYSPDPLPNDLELAVHESRHAAQMQFPYKGWYKPFNWILGEMFPGAIVGIYPNLALLEGDAVVAETALTHSGRGRTADFLEYYMVSSDNGDSRDWYQWRYGSLKRFAPDHYALGYVTVAGMRYLYDDALFTSRYFDYVRRRPFSIGAMGKVMKRKSGERLRPTFDKLMDTFHSQWTEDAAARAPFMTGEQLTATPSIFTTYECGTFTGKGIMALKSSLASAPEIVCIGKDGKERRLARFAYGTSPLAHSHEEKRVYWSEGKPDARYSLKVGSIIRYMDTDTWKKHNLTSSGRYYNPVPTDRGVSATEYPVEGGSALVVLSASDGSVLQRFPAPDSLQVVESARIEDRLFVSAISLGGFGVYEIMPSGDYRLLLGPQPVKIKDFKSLNDNILFTSDLSGVNEMYALNPSSGALKQMTSFKYGAAEFDINQAQDSLLCSVLTTKGRLIVKAPMSSTVNRPVSFNDLHRYEIADRLSAQETALAGSGAPSGKDYEFGSAGFSEPKRYRKLPNIPRFHSWAPIYFNIDNIQGASHDFDFEEASLGATALFQNNLGTANGYIGYSLHEDPYSDKWKNSVHLKFNYSGLFPVFELSFNVNERDRLQYRDILKTTPTASTHYVGGTIRDTPHVSGEILTYIPLNFSSGGWSRGLIPQIDYQISNDMLDHTSFHYIYSGNPTSDSVLGQKPVRVEVGETKSNVYMQKLTGMLRGYIVLPTAESQVYPSLGIGAEAGFSFRPGITDYFTPSVFGYIYGYLPGFSKIQGLRLSGLVQKQLHTDALFGENYLGCEPRGFGGSDGVSDYLEGKYSTQARLSADYSIPFSFGDWSFLCPVAYIKNFVFTPHFDYSFYKDGGLFSAGATFSIHLSNCLWFPFESSVGVRGSYNGGSLFNDLKAARLDPDRFWVGMTFNISM